ncbi:MAG: protein DA1 [Candidatus Zixiibacteriota bacterium]
MKKLPLSIYLLLIVLTTSALPSDNICHYCHKKVEGQWLKVDGNYYHPKHFICANCLKPISDSLFFVQNDRYYDSSCYALFVGKRCDYCGKAIVGEAVYFNSQVFHSSCYNESVGLHCVVCGNVVMSEFFVDKRGNAVCKRHKDDAKRCAACQMFLSPIYNGSWSKLDDGRYVCEHCEASIITDIDEANKLMNEVKAELVKSGIIIDKKYKLTFVSIQELNSQFDNFLVDHLGVTQYERSEMLGGLFSFQKFKINVLYGLPRSLLRSVLAHELMHVWLFANSPQPQDQQMCEGTCQLASYLVLQNDQTEDGLFFMQYLKEQDDEIYGEGFRKVLDYVNSVGLEAWLDYLKHNEEAPW